MSAQVLSPFPYFTDSKGQALNQGYIYVGEAAKDPEIFPVAAYWDEALTIPASQPLRTEGGYAVNGGTPSAFFAAGSYSIRVRDRQGVQVFYRASVTIGDLSAPGGSALIGTKRASLGTSAALRTQASKNDDIFDLRDMAGLDLTGVNDNATLMQAAVTHAIANKVPIYVPKGKITLGSTITISDSVQILGSGCGTGKAIAGYNGVDVTTATRFHLAHNGKGFALDGGGQVFDWVLFRDIMTSRIQPTPSSGVGSFTPGTQDFDFDIYNAAGLQLQNVCMLNPSQGVNMRGGGAIGRLWTDNLMGQPLRVGVNVELSADIFRMHNTHWWAFWQDHIEVHRWTLSNCDHIYLKRCDTPLITNYFSIAGRSGIRLGKNASGPTTKLKATNVDIDYGKTGIWFDSTCTNAWASITNLSVQGAVANALSNVPEVTGRTNILMEGSTGDNFLFLEGVELSGSSGSAINLATANQHVEVAGRFWMQQYGSASGDTSAGINVAANSSFEVNGRIRNTAPGAGPLLGGVGSVIGVRRAYAPSVAASTGSYTAISVSEAQYIESGYNVWGTVSVLFTTIGTGAGPCVISAPVKIDTNVTAKAINITTGEGLVAAANPGTPGTFTISKVGGGNVAVNGQTINLTFDYATRAI